MPFKSWDWIMDGSRQAIRAEKQRRKNRVIGNIALFMSIIILVVSVSVVAFPLIQQTHANSQIDAQARQAASVAAGFPYTDRTQIIQQAVAYNERLAQSGQPIMGEAVDPFTGETGDFSGEEDPEYQNLLNIDGQGTMGRILIPEINVDLPVKHGASQETLERNAGHLHGSSLPVGGEDTHAVITGHSNMPHASLFTRLSELRIGDMFYFEVLGQTLAYKVTGTEKVNPDQVDSLRIQDGKDLMTLVTCAGQGNTKRLLVTGERTKDLSFDPSIMDRQAEGRNTATMTAGIILIPGLIGAGVYERTRKNTIGDLPPQHSKTRKV